MQISPFAYLAFIISIQGLPVIASPQAKPPETRAERAAEARKFEAANLKYRRATGGKASPMAIAFQNALKAKAAKMAAQRGALKVGTGPSSKALAIKPAAKSRLKSKPGSVPGSSHKR